MTANVSKQQFADRVAALVKEYGDAKIKKDDAAAELGRLFGPRWVETLDEVLDEPREMCAGPCKRDEAESNMTGDGLCYVCSQIDRHSANA